jgi:adenosylhomocysteine nucleosidase
MASETHFAGTTVAESLLGDGGSFARVINPTLEPVPNTVLAFVGMSFEAKIAAGPGVQVFSRDRRQDLAKAAENAARHGYRGIVSFGVAGGLSTGLRAGDCVVASAIIDAKNTWATHKSWSKRLCDAIPTAHYGPIIGVEAPVAHPTNKRELHRTTGAAAVDMESHVVADLAAAYGLAFAAVRIIVDPAHRPIPKSALMGMDIGPGGRVSGLAVLRDLVAKPSQLPLLLRVSLDAFIARSEMQRVRQLLGPHFGLTDATWQDLTQPLEQDLVTPYQAPA